MKRSGYIQRKTRIRPRKQRTAEERAAKFAHEYGSQERVEWIAAHGCLACARTPCENHHTANGGKSKKAHHSTIVPLCLAHHDECHHGVKTFEAKYSRMLCGRTLKSWARTYADAWTKWNPQEESHAETNGGRGASVEAPRADDESGLGARGAERTERGEGTRSGADLPAGAGQPCSVEGDA